MRSLFALAFLASAAAQSAPLPNLILACPDANAIGQAGLDSCRGYVYQIPTNQLIVATGSTPSHFWRTASDLVDADTVLVCTIPVEPGKYSSCRDNAGLRRTAFVRKDSVINGGRNTVTVSETGGDYTDPITAAANAFAGDTWCVSHGKGRPCVMAIGEGVFILRETLDIPAGIAVSGNGRGDTLLVADNGVETAVSLSGTGRLSDLTIVNSQPGGARTTGLAAHGGTVQLHDAAIHVTGAAQNVAVAKYGVDSFEILDSDITATGQDSTGIATVVPPAEGGGSMTLERSHVSAGSALDETEVDIGLQVRLVDSQIFGSIRFGPESSRLDIVRCAIVGAVSAGNDNVRVRITGSSIKGAVDVGGMAGHNLVIADTSVEGVIRANHSSSTFTFDGLQLQGELQLAVAEAQILRSYIESPSTAAALSLGEDASVKIEQTFVQGALALAVAAESTFRSSSSVLAGPVSAPANAVLTCADTYGADYELLSAVCQPQPP